MYNYGQRIMVNECKAKREMGGLCSKGHAGTADHPGGCPGQNIM